jgi:transcription antitermination factor NusG
MTILPNIQHTKSYEQVVNNNNEENKESEYINNIFGNFKINSEEISNIDDNFYNFNNYINSMDEVEKNRLSFSNYKNDNLDDHERLALTLQWSIGAEKLRYSLI